MCFQLSFDNEQHERNEVLRKSSYNTASYQELQNAMRKVRAVDMMSIYTISLIRFLVTR